MVKKRIKRRKRRNYPQNLTLAPVYSAVVRGVLIVWKATAPQSGRKWIDETMTAH